MSVKPFEETDLYQTLARHSDKMALTTVLERLSPADRIEGLKAGLMRMLAATPKMSPSDADICYQMSLVSLAIYDAAEDENGLPTPAAYREDADFALELVEHFVCPENLPKLWALCAEIVVASWRSLTDNEEAFKLLERFILRRDLPSEAIKALTVPIRNAPVSVSKLCARHCLMTEFIGRLDGATRDKRDIARLVKEAIEHRLVYTLGGVNYTRGRLVELAPFITSLPDAAHERIVAEANRWKHLCGLENAITWAALEFKGVSLPHIIAVETEVRYSGDRPWLHIEIVPRDEDVDIGLEVADTWVTAFKETILKDICRGLDYTLVFYNNRAKQYLVDAQE